MDARFLQGCLDGFRTGFIYDMSQASAFAVKATENQREFGSRLFRQGGGKNVYSAEIDPMVEQIKNELGEVFFKR